MRLARAGRPRALGALGGSEPFLLLGPLVPCCSSSEEGSPQTRSYPPAANVSLRFRTPAGGMPVPLHALASRQSRSGLPRRLSVGDIEIEFDVPSFWFTSWCFHEHHQHHPLAWIERLIEFPGPSSVLFSCRPGAFLIRKKKKFSTVFEQNNLTKHTRMVESRAVLGKVPVRFCWTP